MFAFALQFCFVLLRSAPWLSTIKLYYAFSLYSKSVIGTNTPTKGIELCFFVHTGVNGCILSRAMIKGVVTSQSNNPLRLLHSFQSFCFSFSLSKSMGDNENTEACLRIRCNRFIRINNQRPYKNFMRTKGRRSRAYENSVRTKYFRFTVDVCPPSDHVKLSAEAPNPSAVRFEALKKKEREE